MSIRFPSDNNSGSPRPNAPRKRGGGGLVFMVIIGVIAFMFMRGISSPGATDPADSNPTERGGVTRYPDLQQDRTPPAAPGDWGLDTDVAVERNASSKKANSGWSENTKTKNGDWGAEEVTTPPTEQPAGRFLQPSNSNVTTPKKPATQGDWSLDTDVDTKTKPVAPKKTTQGDWGLEQIE